MDIELRKSLLYSYLIGLPLGFGFIAAIISLPILVTDEGLLTLVMLVSFGKAILGLSIAFLIALWIGAIVAKNSINKRDKLIVTSFKYSTIVNLIIWPVFGLTATLQPEGESLWGLITVVAFITCTILTTFTIGILISHQIRVAIRK